MYSKIIPSIDLDVASIVDSTATSTEQSHQLRKPVCWLCNTEPATVACAECAQSVFLVLDDNKVNLCAECSKRSHTTRTHHTYSSVVPTSTDVTSPSADSPPFSKLELLSVICIETSHYVCFTRCEKRWLFHDSMADRMCKCKYVYTGIYVHYVMSRCTLQQRHIMVVILFVRLLPEYRQLSVLGSIFMGIELYYLSF